MSFPPPPPLCTRRQWLALTLGAGATIAQALPARVLDFPRDHGSHPELHTEWWYLTGHAQAAGRLWGFQVTFFRSRVDATQGLKSAFAAKQLLFAHAALTDVKGQRLHHDQRIARAGFGVAQASEVDTAVRLRDWSLARTPLPSNNSRTGSRYAARVEGDGFGLDLQCDTAQPPLLQGRQGLSRKGPETSQASYYYSQPQLAVSGAIVLNGRRMAIESGTTNSNPFANRAWLDHEWSDALMHPEAVGWDWIGMNLHDGSALTAFRLRRADGSALWAGGSFRPVGRPTQVFADNTVAFVAQRHWTSPSSGARYPVQWRVETPAGQWEVQALVDNQELDSSGSTGAIYWEGLSELRNGAGAVIGRGYLEMTGYKKPLRL
ncbi:lipocalin-like domain-containing protein [Acidovorax carolinensis]|uniref:lipocalin-like domain-containing protein n=1 Tax=Acidovorax carolinensis TaxID=553814 RepID=UPI000B342C59|nr:carotenoid 1,2-hydratase [Acidovorax carolinensis]ART48976.1 carotenoid 1,2-hydratase [Acidovorax carolinensis]